MNFLKLDKNNKNNLKLAILQKKWIIACLCARWCDSCRKYEMNFFKLSQCYLQYYFVWIDIEDQYDIIGDFDINNFPTLLIQYGNKVFFFGEVKPTISLTEFIFNNICKKNKELNSNFLLEKENKFWQKNIELSFRLNKNYL